MPYFIYFVNISVPQWISSIFRVTPGSPNVTTGFLVGTDFNKNEENVIRKIFILIFKKVELRK